ncbi:MAG: Glutamine--tRNA ligase [Bacteroidetes bacterium ADurb.Bin408]|nr:MAG: Glutamine--tRNA ligase [Bacteroidetes bacterium ADurb.Bin408]
MNSEIKPESEKSLNFIEVFVEEDMKNNRFGKHIHTRFPPEPNGYLHIGHAKSICLNFGLAQKYGGLTNLRFDDTNPVTEDVEYVDSIKEDVRWLGFDWGDREYYASDYFDTLYAYAVKLIEKGLAYVCDLSVEEIANNRGTPTRPGVESPFRNRSVEENLKLFEEMKNGKYKRGEKVLRAKIDMASPNMHMRDPILYRIIHEPHHRTGNKWCIYPSYDFAHGQCDSLEKITHSICTLEFEVHRPLYEWFIKELEIFPSRQIEFARLNLTYTVMSKRKLLRLVKEGYVNGWNDPRMLTICGLRRRGYTPASIRAFAERIGVAKRDNIIDIAVLEFCIREDLNKTAPRAMAVLNPVKLTLINYPEGKTEMLKGKINPEDENSAFRDIPFSKHLYIERDDFMENPPKEFHRLSPGKEVRLKYAYIIKCVDVIKDASGHITEIICTYDPETKSGLPQANRKVKGTIHWVSEPHALKAEVRLFDRLFLKENPDEVDEGHDFTENINPDSLKVAEALCEPSVDGARNLQSFQFERIGYFCCDKDSTPQQLVFNRTVTLKDTWAKISGKM